MLDFHSQNALIKQKLWISKSSLPKIWFLHLIEHFTNFSASCVVYTKRKERYIEKIFEIWISTFGYADKFSVGNRGEFVNDHFISLCDNINIHICTTKAEIP